MSSLNIKYEDKKEIAQVSFHKEDYVKDAQHLQSFSIYFTKQ